jgi:hypothetical protein
MPRFRNLYVPIITAGRFIPIADEIPPVHFQRIVIEYDERAVDQLQRLVERPMRDIGEWPELLIVGYRPFYQWALVYSDRSNLSSVVLPHEFMHQIPMRMDPSRETGATALMNPRLVGSVKSYEWCGRLDE